MHKELALKRERKGWQRGWAPGQIKEGSYCFCSLGCRELEEHKGWPFGFEKRQRRKARGRPSQEVVRDIWEGSRKKKGGGFLLVCNLKSQRFSYFFSFSFWVGGHGDPKVVSHFSFF